MDFIKSDPASVLVTASSVLFCCRSVYLGN